MCIRDSHTPVHGFVTVEALRRGEFAEILVRDTGVGIPKEYVDRVFEKFFRVPGQSSTSGSGLGLAIAKELVEAHRGQIRIESIQDVGTVVAFTLPLNCTPVPAGSGLGTSRQHGGDGPI